MHQNCQKCNVLILQQQLLGWWGGGGHRERGGKQRVRGVISGLGCHAMFEKFMYLYSLYNIVHNWSDELIVRTLWIIYHIIFTIIDDGIWWRWMMKSVPSCFIDKHYYFASILITRALLPSDCSAAAVSPGTLSPWLQYSICWVTWQQVVTNTPYTPVGRRLILISKY